MPEQVKCNLCGSDRHEVVYDTFKDALLIEQADSYAITEHKMLLPLRIVKCSECGLVYTSPRQPIDKLLENYGRMVDHLYIEEERGRRLSARPILRELELTIKKGRPLEIGCSAGFFIDEARKRGWDVYGVELSKWACDYARDNLKIDSTVCGTLEKASYPSEYFDAVVMKDTIEHLIDPKATLAEVRRILKPGGIICITTPDISSVLSRILKTHWWGINQTHFYFFSRKSIDDIVKTSGFTTKKIKLHTRIFSLQYIILKLKDCNEILYRMFSFLISSDLARRTLIRINLRDQVELYAQKDK